MKKVKLFALILAIVMCFQACEKEESVEIDYYDVSGSIKGRDYVDLGLSVKWATYNVGAEYPSEHGDYFAWGEVSPKETYTDENCSTRDVDLGSNISGKEQYDAATANWGKKWRMPTKNEVLELCLNCTAERFSCMNGRIGYRFTSKKNGNRIFFICSGTYTNSNYTAGSYGNYWTSSSTTDDEYTNLLTAVAFSFALNVDPSSEKARSYGFTIRPVTE